MKLTTLCGFSLFYVLLIGCYEQGTAPSASSKPSSKPLLNLPDASFPLSVERRTNTIDDYALLLSQCGNPDSLLSTENDRPVPRIPSRVARYNLVSVNVVMVPHGCEERYDTAMRLLSGDSTVAKNGVNQIKPCVRSRDHGWTIVGYINASMQSSMSAADAISALSSIKEKRTVEPIRE